MAYSTAAATALNVVTKPQTAVAFVSLCGKTAPLVCSAVFLAPLPTVANIASTKSVGSLPLLPYSSMVVNAFIWTVYGILGADSKIWFPNAFGFTMGLYYCSQYKNFVPKGATNLPGTLSQHVRYGALLMTATLLLATCLRKSVASQIIGKLGVIVCMILFASPLSALRSVIETKSAKSIPLPFTLACMLNCLLWSVVGLFDMKDFNIYFPNILGLVSSIAQFSLKLMYGNGPSSGMKSLPI